MNEVGEARIAQALAHGSQSLIEPRRGHGAVAVKRDEIVRSRRAVAQLPSFHVNLHSIAITQRRPAHDIDFAAVLDLADAP